jgi:hypothetical protein
MPLGDLTLCHRHARITLPRRHPGLSPIVTKQWPGPGRPAEGTAAHPN